MKSTTFIEESKKIYKDTLQSLNDMYHLIDSGKLDDDSAKEMYKAITSDAEMRRKENWQKNGGTKDKITTIS